MAITLSGTVSAADWTVNPGQSIQQVVNGANATDTIIVNDNNGSEAIYNENFVVNKNVTVKANGTVKVSASNSSAPVVTINSGGSGSTLNGFIITGATASDGIRLADTTNCKITNNTICNNSVGIEVYSSSGVNEIEGNNISGNNLGIWNELGNLNASFNRIVGNSNYYGVVVSGGTVNAENNWWGSNNRTDVTQQITGANIDYDPWIVLTVLPGYTTPNGTANITASLKYNSNGQDTSSTGYHVPNGINTTFNCYTADGIVNLGTVNPRNTQTTNGTASTTFNAGNRTGQSMVSATVDNQTASASVIIGSAANVSVSVYTLDSNTVWRYNLAVPYIIEVVNNGNDAITGVTITDVLPAGLEYISHSIRFGTGTCTFDPVTGTFSWTTGSIPGKGGVILDFLVRAEKVGNITDVATVSVGGVSKSANYTINVPESADVEVTQTAEQYQPGKVKIVVTAKNNGPSNASYINVVDILPSGLSLTSASATKGTYANGLWTIGDLTYIGNVGETEVLTIYADIMQSTGTITNTATKTKVTGTTPTQDWNATNNGQTVYLVIPEADIQVNQTVNNPTPNYNDNVTITVIVRNNGPDNATGVNVTDLLPSGLQYISSNTAKGTYSNGVWTIGNLANNESVVLTIYAKVVEACTLTNTALKSAEVQYDPIITNDMQTVDLNVPTAADIQVNQTASNQTPLFGDNVTITVNVKNNGPDNATGVKITDLIPAGLSLQSYSTNGKGTFTNGIWDIGNLNSNETATLTLIVKTLVTGNITNTATKTAETEYDYNTTNDYQSIQLNVSPGANHVTNFTTTGGVVNLDDGSTNAITSLPFNIILYGHSYSSFYISTNGLVSFGGKITDFRPSAPYDTAYVAPFWDDIDLQYGGSVYYTMTNDLISITWDKVPSYRQGRNPTQFDTFQLRITRDGKFEFIYGDMEWKVGYSGYGGNSIAGFNKGSWWTYNNFWDASENLSILSNHSYWFDSNGNQIT